MVLDLEDWTYEATWDNAVAHLEATDEAALSIARAWLAGAALEECILLAVPGGVDARNEYGMTTRFVEEADLVFRHFRFCGDEDLYPFGCPQCGRMMVFCYECDTLYGDLNDLRGRLESPKS